MCTTVAPENDSRDGTLPRPQVLPAATYINPPSRDHAAASSDCVVVGCMPGELMRDRAQVQ
jgi:hypothetical protein